MSKPIAVISQKEYLQKYLSGKNTDKKKKKKKVPKVAKDKRSVIVDDDEIKTMRALDEGELDFFSISEDAPQIAGVIDERPEEMRTIETFRSSARWKVISDEYGIEDIRVVAVASNEKTEGNSGDDATPGRNATNDSDESPPRNRNRDDSDESPPRVKSKPLRNLQKDTVNSDSLEDKQDSGKSPPRHKNKSNSDDSLWGKRANRSVSPYSKEKKYESAHAHKSRLDEGAFNERSSVRNDKRQVAISEGDRHSNSRQPSHSKHKTSQRSQHGEQNEPSSRRSPGKFVDRRELKHGFSRSPRQGREFGRNVEGDGYAHRRVKQEPESPVRKAAVGVADFRPRNIGRTDDSDDSPPRRNSRKVREESGETPPRITKKSRKEPDESPPRKSRKEGRKEDSDESPPRKSKKSKRVADEPPARKSRKEGREDDSDESPPRKSRKSKRGSDESPARKSRKEGRKDECNESPQSKSRKNRKSDSDESPPRKNKKTVKKDNDKSTLRKNISDVYQDSDESPCRKSRNMPREDIGEPVRKLPKNTREPPATCGREEEDLPPPRQRARPEEFRGPRSAMGPDAAPIYRDRKTGLKRNLEEEAKQKAEQIKQGDVTKEKYTRWGKGLAQVAATEVRVRDALHEASKPVARHADDADLDRMLRAQPREGDPMLDYIRSKSISVAVPSRPKYKGAWAPNRYNIPPGHRWDGVDRSSGFERRWFDAGSARHALAEEAHKWSVADM